MRLLLLVGPRGALVTSPRISRRSSSLTPIVNVRSPRRARSRRALIRSADVAMCSALMRHQNINPD